MNPYMYVDEASRLHNTSVRTPTTWTVPGGTGLHTSVMIPNVQGYEAYVPTIAGQAAFEVSPFDAPIVVKPEYEVEGDPTSRIVGLEIDTDNVTNIITVTIPYKRSNVGFPYQQMLEKLEHDANLGNEDLNYDAQTAQRYSDETTLTESPVGGEINVNDDGSISYSRDEIIAKDIPGFRRAVYDGSQPIAADGSTLVKVYYDRMYYLLRIDEAGGYGAKPVYAKYGATVTVDDPQRAGYTFVGWQPVDENGADLMVGGVKADVVPTLKNGYVIQNRNVYFRAEWEPDTTAKVTVVFWGENADDTKYSVLDVVEAGGLVGEEISFNHSDHNFVICGQQAHTHDDSCGTAVLDCQHVHTIGCYNTGRNNYSWNATTAPTGNLGDANELEGAAYYYIRVNNTNYVYIHIESTDTLIYGHHMRNRSMFYSLTNYDTHGYYEAHPFMMAMCPEEVYVIEVFAAYVTDSKDHCYDIAISDEEDMRRFTATAARKSDFDSHVEVDCVKDHMVTLSTCAYNFENARYIVIGRLDLAWEKNPLFTADD